MNEQIESAASLMVRDYLLLAFLVSLGSLQIAVSISGIRGLWLLPHRVLTRTLGVLLIAIAIGYYVFSPLWIEGPWAAGSVIDGTSADRLWGTAALDEISAARNVNDIHGGMAGTTYAGFFLLSAVLATLFAAAVGILTTRFFAKKNVGSVQSDGLDALKDTDAISTFAISLRALRQTGLNDARQHMRSAHRWSIPSLIGRMWRN